MLSRNRLPLIFTTLLVAFAGWNLARLHAAPSARADAPDPPDPNLVGNPVRAMQQAQRLMDWFTAHPNTRRYCDPQPPASLLTLPEQGLAEWDDARQAVSFHPYYRPLETENPEVLFSSETFARMDIRRLPGNRAQVNGHGFFIVGYRDKTIRKIDVADVRMYPNADEKNSAVCVFPGTKKYRPDLPKWPWFDNSPSNQKALSDIEAKAGTGLPTFRERWAEAHGTGSRPIRLIQLGDTVPIAPKRRP